MSFNLGIGMGVGFGGAAAPLTFAQRVANLTKVAWWKFDEASGNFLDSSGNANTLTAAGFTYQQPPAKASGFSAQCNSNLATAADNAPLRLIGTDFTIAMMVKCPTAAGIVNKAWLYKDSQWNVGTTAAGKVQFNFPNVGSIITSASDMPLNAWTFIVVTRTGTTYRIYINGILDATATVATAQAAVAAAASVGSTQNDLIDDTFLMASALDQAEITALQAAA